MGINRILRRMGLPGWVFLGAVVSVTIISYGGKALEQILDLFFEAYGARTKTFLVSLVIIVAVSVVPLLAWLWQQSQFNLERMHIDGRNFSQPGPKRGLIILVSNPASALYAIKYHLDGKRLERIWLIPSDGREEDKFGPSSAEIAAEIESQCKTLTARKEKSIRVNSDHAVSPADAQDTFDQVNRIFRTCGFEPGDVVADFTGGTKPMSVGMIMACLPHERALEYVPFNPRTREMHGPYLIDYRHSVFDLIG